MKGKPTKTAQNKDDVSKGATNKKKQLAKKASDKKKGATNRFEPTNFAQEAREKREKNPPPKGKCPGTRSNPCDGKGTSGDNSTVIDEAAPVLTETEKRIQSVAENTATDLLFDSQDLS